MAGPDERYQYQPPPKTIGDRFRQLADRLATASPEYQSSPAGEEDRRRADLQKRAEALISSALEGSSAEPDLNQLVPAVMKALDLPGAKPEEIAASIRKPFNLDEAERQRALSIQREIEGEPAVDPAQPAAPRKPAGSPVEGLRSVWQAATQAALDAKTPEERGIALAEAEAAGKAYKNALDLEQGQVTLRDGTVITSDMLNNPDPAVAAQYQQAFAAAQTDIQNQNAKLLNQYGLDNYSLATGAVAAANSSAIAQYNAQMTSIRERMARDELSLKQASEEVARAINGLQESRARTQQDTDTALAAAPYATTGGKSEFTAADLGGAVGELSRQAGTPAGAAVIKFPGVITLNPAASRAQNDAALGVTGTLPDIPGLSLTDADIPRAPALGNPGAIALPKLIAPTPMPVIRMPGMPGYDSAGPYGPRNTPYLEGAVR